MSASRDATIAVVAEGGERCLVCDHALSVHDSISLRFCQATQSQALSRGCLCPKGSPTS